MSRTIALLALIPVLGCAGATADQADLNSERVTELEQQVAALQERVLTNEGGLSANTTEIARVAADAAAANQGVVENGALMGDLQTRVDGHDLALLESTGALAGLESRLFDPDYGEIPALQASIADHDNTLLNQQGQIDAARAASTANTTAIASLGSTLGGLQPVIAANTALAAANASAIADNRVDIDANTADIFDNTTAVAAHDAAIAGLQSTTSGLQSGLSAANTAIAANSSAISLNTAGVASNSSALGALASTVAGLDADIANNALDIATIQTNTVGPVDELLGYLSVDAVNNTVDITDADLVVDGRLYSDSLHFRKCAGGNYSCTPMACLALCQAQGERLSTTDEVLAWASRGEDNCQWAWMVDRTNPSVPVRAFPMYFNRTVTGCGATNTGDVPRFGGGPTLATGWDTATLSNCACSSN